MPICTRCRSSNTAKNGSRRLVGSWKQTYRCKDCGKRFVDENDVQHEEVHAPKILILDVETAPMAVYTFQLKTDFISPKSIISPTFMISWAAKWLGSSQVYSAALTPQEAVSQDDSKICTPIHQLLSECDIAIAYNGVRFDFKKLNYRFIVNGMNPPTRFRTLDPIQTLRSQFGFDSNAMNHVNGQLGLSVKIDTNFELWRRCMVGDRAALREMETYNRQDVVILEENYLKLRPWMTNHPNLGVYNDHEGEMCKACGSTNVREVLDKYAYTNANKLSLYVCNDCGAQSTGRRSQLTKEKRADLLK